MTRGFSQAQETVTVPFHDDVWSPTSIGNCHYIPLPLHNRCTGLTPTHNPLVSDVLSKQDSLKVTPLNNQRSQSWQHGNTGPVL